MLTFLTTIFTIGYAASNSNPLNGLTPAQAAQLASMLSSSDLNFGGECNLTSLNPAMLIAGASAASASSIDRDKIMKELQTASEYMYIKATSDCRSLDLSSEQCVKDCIRYNHPITLFSNITANKASLMQVLTWYAASGSGIGWYDVGNPDQCEYSKGTYCFTPITNSYNISQGTFACIHSLIKCS